MSTADHVGVPALTAFHHAVKLAVNVFSGSVVDVGATVGAGVAAGVGVGAAVVAGVAVGAEVGATVAAGVAVELDAVSLIRSINRSPSTHGCFATAQVSVPATLSVVADAADSDNSTDPSRAMKSRV